VKVFWALDAKLAYKRHFPAINWLNSYTLYQDNIDQYLRKEVAEDYPALRDQAMSLLQQEAKLEELVRLVGADSLSNRDQLVLLVAKMLREDFLFQDYLNPEDVPTPLRKQYQLLKTILTVFAAAKDLVEQEDFEIGSLKELAILEKIPRAKQIPADKEDDFTDLQDEIEAQIAKLSAAKLKIPTEA